MALQFTEAMGRKYVTVTNAHTDFGTLLDHLKATGETIYISKRGKPVLKIYPLEPVKGGQS